MASSLTLIEPSLLTKATPIRFQKFFPFRVVITYASFILLLSIGYLLLLTSTPRMRRALPPRQCEPRASCAPTLNSRKSYGARPRRGWRTLASPGKRRSSRQERRLEALAAERRLKPSRRERRLGALAARAPARSARGKSAGS